MDEDLEKINWNTYEQMFPERYLRESYFDGYVNAIVNEDHQRNFSCLDIGGGVNGSMVLKQNNCQVTALEPNCEKSHWDVKIGWDSNEKFNLIVARGSLNYLNLFEMRKIVNMIAKGGTFVANSFIKPPTKQVRVFKNHKTGVQGYEMSLLYNKNETTKAVKHFLIILNNEDYFLNTLKLSDDYDFMNDIRNLNFSSKVIDRVIEHEFFYYTLEDYLRMFKKEITFKTYNDNKSVIIRIDN